MSSIYYISSIIHTAKKEINACSKISEGTLKSLKRNLANFLCVVAPFKSKTTAKPGGVSASANATSFVNAKGECALTVTSLATLDLLPKEMGFAELERAGMSGGGHVIQKVVPGTYVFKSSDNLELSEAKPAKESNYRDEHHGTAPTRLSVDATWGKSKDDCSKWNMKFATGSLLVKVPVVQATNEPLAYYGCRLLKKGDVVNLKQSSVIIDFTYESNYFKEHVVKVNGGSGIEHHDFAHIDTPLDEDSGYLVLGKYNEGEGRLELTAFKIAKGESIYIPENCIHTNDYLLGTWRTALTPDCDIPMARLLSAKNAPVTLVPTSWCN